MAKAPPRDPRGIDVRLARLVEADGVLGGLVATRDGLPLAMHLGTTQDGEALAAAAAGIGQLAKDVLRRLDRGEMELGVIDTSRFRLVIRPLSVGFLLVLAEPRASLDLISHEMNAAAVALDQAAGALAGS